MEDKIKDAFKKVKEDIFSLGREMSGLKLLISDMKNDLKILTKSFKDSQETQSRQEKTEQINQKTSEFQEKIQDKHPTQTPTNQHIIPTHPAIPTDNLLSQVLKTRNLGVSIGNGGVPTNKQTNKQTNQQINQHILQEENHLQKASEILDNLDALKKELRRKIKRLTEKEMQVFSLLYNLENQGELVDYPLLALRLKLSESSIRDYIGKIQRKGIPINKEKIGNKKIFLKISPDLKNLASLDTILKLRII